MPPSSAAPAPSSSTSRSSAWPPPPPAPATGSAPPTAASSPSAMPASSGARVRSCSTSRCSAWRRTSADRTPSDGGERRREVGAAREVAVDGGRARAALGDGPHDERLAPAHVATHEHAIDVGRPLRVPGDGAPRRVLDAELVEQASPIGPDEAHGQEDELARQVEVGALDLLELPVDHPN